MGEKVFFLNLLFKFFSLRARSSLHPRRLWPAGRIIHLLKAHAAGMACCRRRIYRPYWAPRSNFGVCVWQKPCLTTFPYASQTHIITYTYTIALIFTPSPFPPLTCTCTHTHTHTLDPSLIWAHDLGPFSYTRGRISFCCTSKPRFGSRRRQQ